MTTSALSVSRPTTPILAAAVLAALLTACSDVVSPPENRVPMDEVPAQLLAAKGGGSGGGELTLEVSPASLELWGDPAPETVPRNATLDVRVMNSSMCVVPDRTARFLSSDAAVAAVDRDGTVTAVGIGEAVITVKQGQTEIPVPVKVDDGVRTPEVFLLIFDPTNFFGIQLAVRQHNSGPHSSPFDGNVEGDLSLAVDGVTVFSGVPEHSVQGHVNIWSSFSDFANEFDLDPSAGTAHKITVTFGGDPPFYTPLSYTVTWTEGEERREWINGVDLDA